GLHQWCSTYWILGTLSVVPCLVRGLHIIFSPCNTTFRGGLKNSWGPWAIGDHGAPVSLPKLKKAYEKSTRGISWCPLLTPSLWTVPKFPNGQSAPAHF
ncbi:unnamed protein product, partial [Staurois parvus]